MKTAFVSTICITLLSTYLNSMNLCLMQHDEHASTIQATTKKNLSVDAIRFQFAQRNLDILQDNQHGDYIHEQRAYENELSILEHLAAHSADLSVQRNAHFILGVYAYAGYRPTYRTVKPVGIDYKKALTHFKRVTNHIKLNPTEDHLQQQAEAYFLMGMIFQKGESYLFGCCQKVKVDHEQALACFTLAHEHAENNPDLQTTIILEMAKLNQEEA